MDYHTSKTPDESTPINCHCEKCPVCNGFGTLRFGKQNCHACQGKGYLIIPNKIEDVDGTSE